MVWRAGADIGLDRNWSINLDVKKMYIGTDVKAGGVKLTTLDLDPMVYSIGVGYRF